MSGRESLQGPEAATWEEVLKRNPRERMKAEKHPLDILQELPELIRKGSACSGTGSTTISRASDTS